MILLLKHFKCIKTLSASSVIIYMVMLAILGYINTTIFIIFSTIDIYMYLIVSNIQIEYNRIKRPTQVKMEIVAEGQHKKKSTDLADIIEEYNEKFNCATN